MLTYFERKKETRMGKATDDLRHEHEVILSVLDIADDIMNSAKLEEVKLKYCNEVLYFLSTFTDKCHHGKEDAYLFPTLVLKGAQIMMVSLRS